jgi:hypothetical protein
MQFALANEIGQGGTREWLGDYYLVAVYNRALDGSEVAQNYQAGAGNEPPMPGTLVVETDATPESDQPFMVTSDIVGGTAFTLVDDGSDTANRMSFAVMPRTYHIAAAQTIGWDTTSASCDNGDTPDAVTVEPGATVVCTFVTEESANERVTDNLQVLYTFQEGSGSTVRDVAGVGDPIDLEIADPASTEWLSGGGLAINSETIIESDGMPTRLVAAAKAANALTIEAWVKPANTTQNGPARIVTLSNGPFARNMTLGQGKWAHLGSDFYAVRMRTTSRAGGTPALESARGSLTTDLTHVVYTYESSSGDAVLYLNGVEVNREHVGGSLANWDTSSAFHLALANEIGQGGTREWLGHYHLVAVYTQALSAAEVDQNFQAGMGD